MQEVCDTQQLKLPYPSAIWRYDEARKASHKKVKVVIWVSSHARL